MTLLALDTSTGWASVALYDGRAVLAEETWHAQRRHGDELFPTIERVLSKAGMGSRTEARAWVAAGRVKVNGRVIRDPDYWIDMQRELVENGKLHSERMVKVRIDESDIMAAARKSCGLERLDQIKYAIVENTGEITVIPKKQAA